MTEDEAKRIVDAISAERFQPFLDECGGDVILALRLYCWDGDEHICHRHLPQAFDTLLRLMQYVSPEKADLHRQHSQVPAVLDRKADVLAGSEPVRV